MIDFKSITRKTSKYNFHSHTQFCDGRANMEDFVKEAIKEGFTHYGFSPHSPVPFESSCNMNKEDVPIYLDEVGRLRNCYGDKINLFASMEIDFIDDWGPNNEYFQTLPLDYTIGSVHFIPSFDDPSTYIDIDGRYASFEKKMGEFFHNDIDSVVRSFFSQSMKMIEAGGFDIIGHFDKIGHNAGHFRQGIENEDWYGDLVKTEFEAIMDNKIIIEVNTKARDEHNRYFPNERYFNLLKKYDAPILVNSDVHYPELMNAGRDEALEKLGLI